MYERVDRFGWLNNLIGVRTNFILKQVEGEWLIWKTRSWTPKFHNDPPKDFVIPNKYPEVFNQ